MEKNLIHNSNKICKISTELRNSTPNLYNIKVPKERPK